MSKIILGNHVSKDGKKMHIALNDAIKLAKSKIDENKININCMQIFVIGPRNTKPTLNDTEKKGIVKIVQNIQNVQNVQNFKLFVHGNYFDNICGEKKEFAHHLIKQELDICEEIGATGLVIHLPKKTIDDIALQLYKIWNYIDSKKYKVKVYLEIESYKSDDHKTYELPHKVAALFKELEKQKINSVFGLCIDSAHLWAANVDIVKYDDTKKLLNDFYNIPQINDYMVHLNDQIHNKGSGRDEHAPLGYGTIWSVKDLDNSGLKAFLEWSQNNDIPLILERKSDKPKINNKPTGCNIISDYDVISKMV
jgi:endonuclease IV